MKINLLPGRVQGKSSLTAAWAALVLLIVAELAGLGFYQSTLRAREDQMSQELTTKQQQVTAVEAIGAQAREERAKVATIDTKVKFVKELTEYNDVRPDLFARTIEYTLDGVRYTSMNASQNLMQIGAWAPSLSDAGRYLLFMENSPDFSAVRISGVPGYPPGGQTGAAASGGPGEAGAFPGSGAQPLTSGGGPPPGMTSGGGFAPGAGGPAGDLGQGPPGGPAGGAFGPGGGGGQGGGGGGGRTVVGGAYQNAGARFQPPKPPQGFPFTVTAQLVKPIVRPVFGATPQQPGFGGGAFGPAGAMPGEFGPGAMPGGSGASMYGPGGAPGPEAGMPAAVK